MCVRCAYTVRMTELKTQRVNLRVASRDDELFRQAAAVADETLSEFLVEGGRERASRLLADRRQFVLSEEDWSASSHALDRPAQADPALVELFRRQRTA